MVQQRALDVLKGHLPFTASFMKGDQEWYRARFAGFSQDDAEAACAALKKLSLDCAIMRRVMYCRLPGRAEAFESRASAPRHPDDGSHRRHLHAPSSTSFASLIRAAR